MPLPELIEIEPLICPGRAEITVPGSKSITNRALVLAALAEGVTTLKGALWSEDTEVMVNCLHRLGFEENDINELCVRLKNAPAVVVKSVFSHLVASDESEHDEFTKKQISSYKMMCGMLENHLGYPFLKHILNSAGAMRFRDEQLDMVRLGIGMHGFSSASGLGFIPTVQLKTVISQIKQVAAGDTVGYSRKGKVTRNSRIATVPIGYADGFTRKLGNGIGSMLINGKQAPTIGNICMDMTMLDVTDIPDVREGDEVEIFGTHQSVTDLAVQADTIAYEILTGISQRVKRVYYEE